MKNSKKDETKREKFIRITENRVNTILDQLRKLSNLSNKNYYEYNSDDVRKIFNAINREMKNCKDNFNEIKKDKEKKFKF